MADRKNLMIESLYDDGERALFRSREGADGPPRLILTAVAEQPAPHLRARLENAHSLRDELDTAWAARPLELLRRNGRYALVLEDPGGTILSRLVGAPWDTARFLGVAIAVAGSLGRLHERGLVHRDVKPANLFVDDVAGKAWLAGFGITSRLGRERRRPGPPDVIAGTLAYMAPEQ